MPTADGPSTDADFRRDLDAVLAASAGFYQYHQHEHSEQQERAPPSDRDIVGIETQRCREWQMIESRMVVFGSNPWPEATLPT